MPRRDFSLFYPSLPPENLRSCYSGVGEMLDIPIREEMAIHRPESWALPLIRRGARFIIPDYDPPVTRRDGKTEDSRDDNGSYFSEGSYREGDRRRYLVCEWHQSQGEEMMYPTPWRRSSNFQARGLGRGKRLILSISQSGPGSYTSEADSAMVIVRIQASTAEIERIERFILGEIAPLPRDASGLSGLPKASS